MEKVIDTNQKLDLNKIISLTNELSALLKYETELLNDMRIEEVAKIQEEKIRIIEILEAIKVSVRATPEILDKTQNELFTKVKEASKELDNVMQANYTSLLKAYTLNNKVIELIISAVKEYMSEKNGYNDNGNYEGPKEITSFAFNNII